MSNSCMNAAVWSVLMGLFLIGFYNKRKIKTMENNHLQSLSCKSGYSVLYAERENTGATEKQLEVLSNNWGKVDYKGELSKATSRKIAHLLQIWYRTLIVNQDKRNLLSTDKRKQLVFLTLTLSSKQQHSDNVIKREMLNHFIITLNRKFGMVNYLWKAEPQKNGNIHFHIVTDIYIDKNKFNYEWDKIQAKHGYIKNLQPFDKEYTSPSTRIEVINTNDGISHYMAKYVGKAGQERAIEGRCWGCSKSVRELKDYQFAFDSEVEEIVCKAIESRKIDYKVTDYCVVFNTDFFFQLYYSRGYHSNLCNLLYAENYHRLYSNQNKFCDINGK